MSELNSFQRKLCVKYLDNIAKWDVSFPFINFVDPINDGAANYNEIIKEPMAINEVKRKLESQEYNLLSELLYDVKLIWKNSESYNGRDAPFTLMAKDIYKTFKAKALKLPLTPEEEWFTKMKSNLRKFHELLLNPPPEIEQNSKGDSHDEETPRSMGSKGSGKGKKSGKTIRF